MEGPAAPASLNGELVFEEPWEGRALGIAVALNDQRVYEWREFRQHLVESIAADEEAGTPSGYYNRWLRAMESLLLQRGLVTSKSWIGAPGSSPWAGGKTRTAATADAGRWPRRPDRLTGTIDPGQLQYLRLGRADNFPGLAGRIPRSATGPARFPGSTCRTTPPEGPTCGRTLRPGRPARRGSRSRSAALPRGRGCGRTAAPSPGGGRPRWWCAPPAMDRKRRNTSASACGSREAVGLVEGRRSPPRA